ncbi:MAG: ABC transporter permease, partial [Paracoccaceae bacterium]
MLYLIYRQGRQEIGRVLLTILAIAAIIAEILVLEGFLAGNYAQLRSAVLSRGGDVMVTQSGISNFIAARSILPQTTRAEVEKIPGVATANPLTSLMTIYKKDGRRTPVIILVYDTTGGPGDIIAGTPITGNRDIVIDQSLARRYDLVPGDPLVISNYEFNISGVTTNSAAFFSPFAFLTYDGLIDFYFDSDVATDIAAFPLLSFLSVEVTPGSDPAIVAKHIRDNVIAADAFLPADLAERDVNLGRELLGPIL